MSAAPKPSLQLKFQLLFSVAFAITFTTGSLLKAVSHLLAPRWAPQLPLPRISHRESCASPVLRQSLLLRQPILPPNLPTLHLTPTHLVALLHRHVLRALAMACAALSLNTAAAWSEGINSDNDNANLLNGAHSISWVKNAIPQTASDRRCVIADCDKPRHVKQHCCRHYQALRREAKRSRCGSSANPDDVLAATACSSDNPDGVLTATVGSSAIFHHRFHRYVYPQPTWVGELRNAPTPLEWGNYVTRELGVGYVTPPPKWAGGVT
jgi:hypothetical protein